VSYGSPEAAKSLKHRTIRVVFRHPESTEGRAVPYYQGVHDHSSIT
jgi:hypothetical protein